MKPHNRFVEIANSSFGFLYLLLGGWGGGGGDDDDSVTQTPRTISPESQKSRFTRCLQQFRVVGTFRALRVLASPSHVQLASLVFAVYKRLRFRF